MKKYTWISIAVSVVVTSIVLWLVRRYQGATITYAITLAGGLALFFGLQALEGKFNPAPNQ